MLKAVFYILCGYLLGSLLFARVAGQIFGKDVVEGSRDGNPGTANAFLQGGFLCGMFTLIGDIGKGFAPVWLYLLRTPAGMDSPLLPLIIAAPVIGHIFPIFHRFRGGKGIATSFGCFLALIPALRPFGGLVFFFLFYSLILRISPHYYRTLVTYLSLVVYLLIAERNIRIVLGAATIAFAVVLRLLKSPEEKKEFKVKIPWKH